MKKNLKIINDYYSEKVKAHGATPSGVDWNGEESQFQRFSQLSKVFDGFKGSCADIGCGYGAYLDYLFSVGAGEVEYTGYDLSQEMIDAAKRAHPDHAASFFAIESLDDIQVVDYAVASGIFNVRQDISDDEWQKFVFGSLAQINAIASKGFAFNILTSYSDVEKRREYLYYAVPEVYFAFCKNEFSNNVALLHDYDLYEFTIIVRK